MTALEEESWYQAEFQDFGEHTQIPQWEAIQEAVIADTTETSSVYRQPKGFEDDLVDGFI